MTEQEQKAFTAMREALKSSAVCIQLMSDGPSRASWVDTLDIIDSAITAANAVSEHQREAFPTIQLGFGKVEVAEGWLEGAPALIFGKNGTGVIGGATEPNREHKQGETLAAVTFANVASLDVVLAKLGKLRADKFPEAHPQATEQAWRPIESAPHSANPVLALSESGTIKIETGYWLVNMLHASKVDGENCNYTHWMPLPAAPEAP